MPTALIVAMSLCSSGTKSHSLVLAATVSDDPGEITAQTGESFHIICSPPQARDGEFSCGLGMALCLRTQCSRAAMCLAGPCECLVGQQLGACFLHSQGGRCADPDHPAHPVHPVHWLRGWDMAWGTHFLFACLSSLLSVISSHCCGFSAWFSIYLSVHHHMERQETVPCSPKHWPPELWEGVFPRRL